MNIRSVLRVAEWWEYKLIPILLVGYVTAIKSEYSLLQVSPWILFIFLSLIVGASYVSVINDITDIKEDLASGKKNRMASISAGRRWIIPAAMVALGLVFGYFYAPHTPSVLLYLASWIAFSCYSIPPIRLKNKSFWGVIADASGSQFFPSLLMVAFISFKTFQPIDFLWFSAVGCWSLALGLRGILWHQFHDLQNDRKVGLNTLAMHLKPVVVNMLGFLLMTIEAIALLAMLYYYNSIFAYAALVLYFAYLACLHRVQQISPIIFNPSGKPNFRILLFDYYIVFFPIAVLIEGGIQNPMNWILMLIHLILFPSNIYSTIQNIGTILHAAVLKFKPGK